ncbi:MAG: HD domain-containing protein [Pseudomonadota bacterium]
MNFTNIAHAGAADWDRIIGESAPFTAALPDRILAHLKLLEGDYGGFPVDRLTHCLQTATLAHQAGKDDEYLVCALLHDIGDTLASYNHADLAATILQPFVSEANHWMVEKHAIFQGYYFFQHLGLDRHMRDAYKNHPCYRQTVEFCALYDAPAFNPDGETLPLSFFEPMVRKVFAKPRRSLYQRADGEMSF